MPDILNPTRLETPYSSQFPPELQQDAAALRRHRALVDLLLARGLTPPAAPTSGGITLPISPLASLASAAALPAALMAGRKADTQEADLTSRYAQGLSDAQFNVGEMIKNKDYSGAAQIAGRYPAMKTITDKLLERQFPQTVLSTQFNPQSGREEHVAFDLHNPSAPALPVGGQKAPTMVKVEAAGPTGEPQTQFVDPNAQTAPIPSPVKMAFENTGGEITPVNPYTQTDPLKKTIDPNRVPTPEDLEANAQLIAKYKMAPIQGYGQRAPGGAAIMRRVAEINPGYDAKLYNTGKIAEVAFGSGKQGNTIRSFNVALNHLDTLSGLSDQLNNVEFRPGNKLYNYATEQLGYPAPTNFDAAKKIVGDEIVKAIVGSGGGVGDREKAEQTIGRANSPEQLKGVIQTYKTLMSGQLQGLRQQYMASTGKEDFDKFLQRRASDQPGAGGLPSPDAIDAELRRRQGG